MDSEEDAVQRHLELKTDGPQTIRLTTGPLKLKDKQGRNFLQLDLEKVFGHVPNVIYIKKIYNHNNQFEVIADIPVKGGDNLMDNKDQNTGQTAPDVNQTPANPAGSTDNTRGAVETPGEQPVVGEGVDNPGQNPENPNNEAPAPVSDTPSVPATGAQEENKA